MRMKVREIKLSGTGWLFIRHPSQEIEGWMPVFQLTPQQIREYKEVEQMFTMLFNARKKP